MRTLILSLCVTCFLATMHEPVQASPPSAAPVSIDYGWTGFVAFPQPDGSVYVYYCEWIPPGAWLTLYGPWVEPAPGNPVPGNPNPDGDL